MNTLEDIIGTREEWETLKTDIPVYSELSEFFYQKELSVSHIVASQQKILQQIDAVLEIFNDERLLEFDITEIADKRKKILKALNLSPERAKDRILSKITEIRKNIDETLKLKPIETFEEESIVEEPSVDFSEKIKRIKRIGRIKFKKSWKWLKKTYQNERQYTENFRQNREWWGGKKKEENPETERVDPIFEEEPEHAERSGDTGQNRTEQNRTEQNRTEQENSSSDKKKTNSSTDSDGMNNAGDTKTEQTAESDWKKFSEYAIYSKYKNLNKKSSPQEAKDFFQELCQLQNIDFNNEKMLKILKQRYHSDKNPEEKKIFATEIFKLIGIAEKILEK